MEGKHPALLFARHAKPGNGRPIKKLVGFQTVRLGAGEKTEIEYELSPCEHLSSANEDGVMVMEEGSQILLVGDKEHPIHNYSRCSIIILEPRWGCNFARNNRLPTSNVWNQEHRICNNLLRK
ncbi:hypothetical protein OIU84_023914 [Salix udensis]|uniref:Fibronectin type III-like domain-containing protein n=1 Tax=Salix udensis TaxID=889485 RepID=A0AAD6J644_9ROSI|nr:hypothetical protein OIU84_023914 [Salix udensis]